jgi:hypothetical protein
MKNIKEIKSNKIQKGINVETKRKDISTREKSTIEPEEYEEDRSMKIRMKPQPFQSSAKPEKKKNKK